MIKRDMFLSIEQLENDIPDMELKVSKVDINNVLRCLFDKNDAEHNRFVREVLNEYVESINKCKVPVKQSTWDLL